MLVALLLMPLGCGDEQDGSSGTTAAMTTADGETTSYLPEDPAMCAGMTCAEGQICLSPSPYCDDDGSPPGNGNWVAPDDVCVDVPPQCLEAVSRARFDLCIGLELCESEELEEDEPIVDGVYECNATVLIC